MARLPPPRRSSSPPARSSPRHASCSSPPPQPRDALRRRRPPAPNGRRQRSSGRPSSASRPCDHHLALIAVASRPPRRRIPRRPHRHPRARERRTSLPNRDLSNVSVRQARTRRGPGTRRRARPQARGRRAAAACARIRAGCASPGCYLRCRGAPDAPSTHHARVPDGRRRALRPRDPPGRYAPCVTPALRHAGMGGQMGVNVLNAVLTGVPSGPCKGYLLGLQAAAQAAGEQARWLLPTIYGPDRQRAQHKSARRSARSPTCCATRPARHPPTYAPPRPRVQQSDRATHRRRLGRTSLLDPAIRGAACVAFDAIGHCGFRGHAAKRCCFLRQGRVRCR